MSDKISIRDFVRFSLFVSPLNYLVLLYKDEIIKHLVGSELMFFIILYLIFVVLNWLWGQKKLKGFYVLISCIIGNLILYFYFFPLSNVLKQGLGSIIMGFIGVAVLYPLIFLVFGFIQFSAWIPFLAKYIFINKHRLTDLRWE